MTCWNGHREVRATSAQNTRNNGSFMYTNMRIRGMDGRGWGVGMGCQWLARLVPRVYLYAIWMGEAGEGGGGWGWVANG